MKLLVGLVALGAGALLGAGGAIASSAGGPSTRYIVEGSSSAAASAAVSAVNGRVLVSLPIVHGVAAELTGTEAAALGDRQADEDPAVDGRHGGGRRRTARPLDDVPSGRPAG